jgi:hypothetical protein
MYLHLKHASPTCDTVGLFLFRQRASKKYHWKTLKVSLAPQVDCQRKGDRIWQINLLSVNDLMISEQPHKNRFSGGFLRREYDDSKE